MSRYIKLADALRVLADTCYLDKIDENMQKLPSIDIVRCKECRYEPICSHSVQHTTHEPTSVTIGYKAVDFCSYGEK